MEEIGEVDERGFVVEWTVRDFFTLPEKDEEPYYGSFSFDGARWCLSVYPHGQKEKKSEGYVGLYLCRESPGPPIELDCSVGLKTSRNEIAQEVHYRHNFENQFDNYGWIRFIRRSTLLERQSELAPFGHLTCVCRLKHPQSSDTRRDASSTSQPVVKSKLLEDLKQLLQNQENCDVVLRVKGREFPAHRAILTARSSVFASAFRTNNSTGVVDIEDCDPSTFSDFLLYLYCEDLGVLCDANVCSLFTTAEKYDVSDLRERCLEFIRKNLSVDTFCDALALALRHSETELVPLVGDFFVANADRIIVTDAWKTFAAEHPVQSNELFIKFVASVKSSH